VDPRVGKMLLWAQFFGVSRRAASLAATMSSKSVFTLPVNGQRSSRVWVSEFISLFFFRIGGKRGGGVEIISSDFILTPS
jgi:hypothetical protein